MYDTYDVASGEESSARHGYQRPSFPKCCNQE